MTVWRSLEILGLRNKMFKTTRGLVLREVQYKEADRILTVLTEDMGKMTIKARGALRKGSKTAAATQLFVFSELTLLERNGYWSVSEGSTIEEFKGLRGDITALSLASYFAECAEALSNEGNPDNQLLQLVLNSLFALSNELYSQKHIKTAFEMRLMSISGYEPNLLACSVCGNSEPTNPRFSPRNGIICCCECNSAQLQADYELCPASLQALRYIIYAPARKMLAFTLPDAALERASKVSEAYLLTQTERRFSTLDYWRQIK